MRFNRGIGRATERGRLHTIIASFVKLFYSWNALLCFSLCDLGMYKEESSNRTSSSIMSGIMPSRSVLPFECCGA